MKLKLAGVLLLLIGTAFANSPGKHAVTLKWSPSTTTGVTYNVYRGTAAGVCSGTPTPYATGVASTQYIDTVGLSDGQTLFYNVSAVGSGGAESACDGEIQVQIPVLPSAPTSLSGVAQ
jgi:hypothetical protein